LYYISLSFFSDNLHPAYAAIKYCWSNLCYYCSYYYFSFKSYHWLTYVLKYQECLLISIHFQITLIILLIL